MREKTLAKQERTRERKQGKKDLRAAVGKKFWRSCIRQMQTKFRYHKQLKRRYTTESMDCVKRTQEADHIATNNNAETRFQQVVCERVLTVFLLVRDYLQRDALDALTR